ncbi:hypothetical protein BDV96DRAFT_368904 [Lophiotrema nucula]|uniref:RING-type domain-containing protein n=1 Tax=Lophiotrema nucula TaxID=690887 RepID=A0A6A5ZJH5_9PLEO|nr:hypothetical protein BDV96DRAFT_368904 [Lophiotrema nucula]
MPRSAFQRMQYRTKFLNQSPMAQVPSSLRLPTRKKLCLEYILPCSTTEVECSICRLPFSAQGTHHGPAKIQHYYACGHVFGYRCFLRWIHTGANTCPMCRRPLAQGTASEGRVYEIQAVGNDHRNVYRDYGDVIASLPVFWYPAVQTISESTR